MHDTNLALMERDLATKKAAIEKTLGDQLQAAEKEKRERTDDEKKAVDTMLAEAKSFKARIDAAKGDRTLMDEIARLTSGTSANVVQRPSDTEVRHAMKSIGQQLIEAEDWKAFIKAQGHRKSGVWTSPSFDFEAAAWLSGMQATTLDTTGGSGGPLIVTQYQPGIVDLRFKRLVVADLIAPGQTDSNSITYMKETTFTNAAAPVTEGAAKPESTLVFAQVTDPVQKIAHVLPITEEMLEDYPQTRSYVDGRLRFGVQLAEEDQLLNGSGTPPAIRGILNRSGLATPQARGTDPNPDAIFKQITNIATTAFVQPDGIVINPTNWQTIVLSKNANGDYYAGGPFAPMVPPRLWGVPVVATPTIAAGTGLVGAFAEAAQIFRKGGIRVEASNSHNDYFVKNLVALRAEERLALAVYRPGAFGAVTGLN
jgi:HK97 family phage major capsid protein